jgi:hypothetical protein
MQKHRTSLGEGEIAGFAVMMRPSGKKFMRIPSNPNRFFPSQKRGIVRNSVLEMVNACEQPRRRGWLRVIPGMCRHRENEMY